MIPPISEIIRERIKNDNGSFNANENISKYIKEGELDLLQEELAKNLQAMLNTLIIDTVNDHNTQETANRVAKMYLKEVFSGRYFERPTITDFPNAKELDEIYTLGPIDLRSACSHHFVEIEGSVWIGIMPSDRVIGISKFARLLNWISNRPHIQEEMSIMLADELELLIKPKGLAIVIKAKHHCMTWRGVKEKDVSMVSSVVRGVFRDNIALKKEFFDIIRGQGF
jgi:GTP cyclohydrolase IA